MYVHVFQNRVLRKVFGSKEEEVTGDKERSYNEELHDLYSSQTLIQAIKSRRMRWVGCVAHVRKKRKLYRVLVGKPEGNSNLEVLGIDGRIMLK
jgi:hypothetical protein